MKSSWIFVALIAALSGCQLIPGFNPTPTNNRPAPGTTPAAQTVLSTATATPAQKTSPPAAPSATPPAPLGPFVLVPQTLNASSAKPPYEIKIRYPEIAGAALPGLTAFNAEAKKQAQDLLASFQKDFDQAQPLPEPSAATGSFMETNYTVTYGQHGMLSVLYSVGFYFSGAAHPNSYAMALNFNLIQGKKMELAELFLPGSDFLKAVSEACTADLKKRDRLAFPEGALPNADNYKNWNISPQGLRISFDPYQVAPYAMGPTQIVIPYASLKALIKPDGPLTVLNP